MRNIIVAQKIILLMLLTVFLICTVQSISHGGGAIGGIVDGVGAVGTAVGTAVGAVGTAIGAAGTAVGTVGGIVVDVIAGTAQIAAGVLDLSVRLVATFVWHTDSLSSMTVIPNGGLIGIVFSNLIELRDPHFGALHTTLRHDSPVNSIAFNPDGSLLASGSGDNVVRLWIPDTETLQATLHGHAASVLSVAFSSDGSLLASGSADGTIRIWTPHTETLQATLHEHTASVLSVAFSPDGSLLASGSGDGTVRLWDLVTETLQATLYGHMASVSSITFSPDGLLLASASADGLAGLWDPHTETLQTTLGHESPVLSIAFSPDGDFLATGSTDGTARLWDPHMMQLKATLGHESPVESVAFDGNMLVSGSQDGRVRQWEITTPTASPDTTNSRIAFESTTPAGYTPVTLRDTRTVWGVPTKFTTDSDVGTVAYMLLATVKGCSFANAEAAQQSKVYIKTQSLGLLNNFASETACRKTSSTWTSSWNGVRITHLRFFDESSFPNIQEAVYNAATGQIELTGEGEQPLTAALEADANNDGVVSIDDLVLVASNYGKTGQNAADVNGDGVVNIDDLTTVAGALDNAAAAPLAQPQALEMFTAADVKLWLSHAQRLDLTDATSLRGILFLERLLAALLPKETVLLANYPNPFNPETWIPYRLAEDAFVTLTIYDGSGQVIRTLDVGYQTAAFYETRSKAIYWDGKNEFGEGIASGMYFYHLSAGDFSATRKMLIIK